MWPVDENLAHDIYLSQAILIDFIIINTPGIFVRKYQLFHDTVQHFIISLSNSFVNTAFTGISLSH